MSELLRGAPRAEDALAEVARCLLCGSEESELRFEEPPFRVVRCKSCALVWVTPRRDPSRLVEIYQTAYWHSDAAKDFGYTDYQRDASLYRRTYLRRYSAIARHCKTPGEVLDVGCAAGFFLSVMKEKGWRTQGVEVSGYIAEFGRKNYGLDVIVGTLDEAAPVLGDRRFDLITFWDVVEHLPDPIAVLRRAASFLRPGGKLLLETQNVRSLFARVLGQRWQHYKHHEHLYHFDPRTVRELCRQAGLRVIENRARLGGKYVSLGFVRERAGRVHPLLSTLLFPLKLVERSPLYVNLFDEMIVVCEKA
ncbi:MAG: class I SAM-dependent methyltransferase [Planctomycetes bacterium]|nr:class I SAM-dependent methyltransferase [Planctomycetota bacterium]